MAETIIDNLKKDPDGSNGFYECDDGKAGVGVQFILYTPAVITHVAFKLQKRVWNPENPPTGTLTARLCGSHNGNFRDLNDYADGFIAESTSSIDVAIDLAASQENNVYFTFDDVELPAGIYFLCLYSENFLHNEGDLQITGTPNASALVGAGTFWGGSMNRWLCYLED
jgi:hypothetical protein